MNGDSEVSALPVLRAGRTKNRGSIPGMEQNIILCFERSTTPLRPYPPSSLWLPGTVALLHVVELNSADSSTDLKCECNFRYCAAVSRWRTAAVSRSLQQCPATSNSMNKITFFISPLLYHQSILDRKYKGWNFNSGNYLFTTDTK